MKDPEVFLLRSARRKDPDAGKDWRQEGKRMTEDEMVGWHHWLNGHEFEQALGVGDGQGSLACCNPWGRKESDTTERLCWTEIISGPRRWHSGKENAGNIFFLQSANAGKAGNTDLLPALGKSLGGGNGNPLQYSCLGNPMDQRNLVGYSPWGHKESDMTERLNNSSNLHLRNYHLSSFPFPEPSVSGLKRP